MPAKGVETSTEGLEMPTNRYYLTERPPMPGTFPNHDVVNVMDYGEKIFIEEINAEAWGYVDYSDPLRESEINAYELTYEKG